MTTRGRTILKRTLFKRSLSVMAFISMGGTPVVHWQPWRDVESQHQEREAIGSPHALART
jgi:hypothetical protein